MGPLDNITTKNQIERILLYLRQGNSITSMEAQNLFGCSRLASRIHDIERKFGVTVSRKFEPVINRFQREVKIKRYWLEPGSVPVERA